MSASSFFLRLFGFKTIGFTPEEFHANPELKKCVIVMAPHTSYVDFLLGRLCIKHLRLKMAMAMKKEFFVFPLKGFLEKIGCVPVDRQHAIHFADFAVQLINSREEVAFIICPEGTRELVKRWKRGFYQIAENAGVPICLSHIDFKSRTIGVGQIFHPSGDFDKDMEKIAKYYAGMRGFRKGKFNYENLKVE
ncbi:MAG: 1-acyl-sn-glycerol-3-phosphate acyltransferase [Bacteroidales bacterium]|nr:1-acyl-sn-glycerol-3-phosphate acyltransferase [Bacteroidales bacterium]